MGAKKVVKIELSNSRFDRLELKDHASEFIHYAKYAGYILDGFNKHVANAKLFPLKPEIAERNHRLILETTVANAKIIFQITKIYPSFKNWTIKSLTPGINLAPVAKKEEVPTSASTKKKATKKSVTKKAVKKKTVKKKTVKKVAKKKVTKKKPAVKKVAKKSVKKKTAKKVAKKKAVKKKPAKKVVAKKTAKNQKKAKTKKKR